MFSSNAPMMTIVFVRGGGVRALLILFLVLMYSCKEDNIAKANSSSLFKKINHPSSNSKSIKISWNKNRESRVNSLGGGYKVYYSQSENFDISTAMVLDVPSTLTEQAATTANLKNLVPGTYYVKIRAYYGNFLSEPSSEVSIAIP